MAIVIAVLCSLAAAFLNAASSVLQRRAAGAPDPSVLFRRHFIAALSKNRLWLSGLGLQIIAAFAQGAALFYASLVLVEPLLTVDLVFLLLLLHFYFRIPAGRREWSAVLAICGGLSMLLAAANPRGGHLEFSGLYWLITSTVVAVVILASIITMRRSASAKFRAGVGGVATGLSYALTAGFTKLMLGQLHHGIGQVFSGWELYALCLSGLVSLIMSQNTFAAGPLAISQPAIEISDPLASAFIGVILFGDIISTGAASIALEVIGALVAAIGIALMGSSKNIYSPARAKPS